VCIVSSGVLPGSWLDPSSLAQNSIGWTTTFSAGQGALLPELPHHRQCHCDRETGIERFDIVISIVSVSILSEPFLTNPGIAESATCEIAGLKRRGTRGRC